jgi:hypothetical protein
VVAAVTAADAIEAIDAVAAAAAVTDQDTKRFQCVELEIFPFFDFYTFQHSKYSIR